MKNWKKNLLRGQRIKPNILAVNFISTDLTAGVLKQDPNTQRVKKNADFNRTTQNMRTVSERTPFSKQRIDR